MKDQLIVDIKSEAKKKTKIKIVIYDENNHDKKVYERRFLIFPGENYIIIDADKIGAGRYHLKIYHRNKLIGYRNIEILRHK